MKNNLTKHIPQIFYLLFMLLLSAYVAYQAWGYSLGYEYKTNKLTQQLDMGDNFKTASKRVFEAVTFSLYDGYTEQLEEMKQLQVKGQEYRDGYHKYIKIFIGLAVLSLLLHLLMRTAHSLFTLLLVATVALVVGLFAPILAIVAYENVPMLGRTVFQYESKSILSALVKLFEKEQFFIGGIILLFTVIIPILKTLLMGVIIYARNFHFSAYSINVLKNIGKWSMLDVFVIAIIVTYFTSKQSGATDASLEPGVYFFTVYVLCSMLVSFFIYRHQETHNETAAHQ